jgi:hypothetical protein
MAWLRPGKRRPCGRGQERQQVQLRLPENGDGEQPRRRCARAERRLPYSDIDLSRWRDYADISTDSLWIIPSRSREGGHRLDYWGNFVPQIARQVFQRFSRQGDVVLDLFLGSGTSALEAMNLGRRLIGVEIDERLAQQVRRKLGPEAASLGIHVLTGDSSSRRIVRPIRRLLQAEQREFAQLLVLHPPYHDIIRFTPYERDLSNAPDTASFLRAFRRVARIGFELLQPERFAVLVIGDKYEDRELVPLGFLTMQQMVKAGFRVKSIVVKNIVGNERGKGKATNLWRYRALAGGFYIFRHEYVIIFQKP